MSCKTFPSRTNVGGQSPTKMASRSARALRSLSETAAERAQSESAATIEPKPRLCIRELFSPIRRSASATFIDPPFFDCFLQRGHGLSGRLAPKHRAGYEAGRTLKA